MVQSTSNFLIRAGRVPNAWPLRRSGARQGGATSAAESARARGRLRARGHGRLAAPARSDGARMPCGPSFWTFSGLCRTEVAQARWPAPVEPGGDPGRRGSGAASHLRSLRRPQERVAVATCVHRSELQNKQGSQFACSASAAGCKPGQSCSATDSRAAPCAAGARAHALLRPARLPDSDSHTSITSEAPAACTARVSSVSRPPLLPDGRSKHEGELRSHARTADSMLLLRCHSASAIRHSV